MFELIIRGGIVIDGTGQPGYRSDIGIRGGRIVAVERLATDQAHRNINADGLVVAPGFIDIHSHSGFTLLINPRGESKIRQGITTEVIGNCGISAAPIVEAHRDELLDFLSMTLGIPGTESLPWDWHSFGDYLDHMRRQPLGVNVAALVGHTTLRIAAMGAKNRAAMQEEIAAMQALLDVSLEEGAVGLSSGLEYPPASFSTGEELIALGRVLASHDRLYASHVRSEDLRLWEAIAEAVQVGEQAGCRVEISHLKLGGVSNWGKAPRLLGFLDRARERGVEVAWDQYPYVAWGSSLIDYLPAWVVADGREVLSQRLQDESIRQAIRTEIDEAVRNERHPLCAAPWDKVRIALVASPHNRPLEGLTIAQIATAQNRDPLDVVLDLLAEERGAVKTLVFCVNEEDIRTIMQHPLTAIATDGRAVAPYGALGQGRIHPRYYGTFPRVLGRYVYEENLLELETAIHKMSLLPAQRIGLTDRGCIAPGMAADLVVFDPASVRDRATYEDPHQYPEGIAWVFIRGEAIVDHQEHTGALAGQVLTRR